VEQEKGKSFIDRDKYVYEVTRVRGADGRMKASRTNGDAVARAMLGMSPQQVEEVIAQNGLSDKLGRHIGVRTPGQLRMLAGNALRHMLKQGSSIVIGDNTIKRLDQEVTGATAVPRAPKGPAKAPAAKETPSGAKGRATKSSKKARK